MGISKQSNSADAAKSVVERACPACRESQASHRWEKADTRFVQCECCGMVYVREVPLSFVNGAFYEERTESFYLSEDKLQSDYDPIRFQREWKLFHRWVPSGRILDVGCSTGGFLRGLSAFGSYDLTGLDVSQGALDQAERQGIHVVREPFLDWNASGPLFDAITFWAVLEHVEKPDAFLHKAGDLIQPGGICILLVPNLHSLAIRCLGRRYRYIMAEHLNYFSAGALQRMVQRVGGWGVEEVTTMHFNPVVMVKDALRPRAEVPDAERAQLLKRTNRLKKSPLMAPLKVVYSGMESVLTGLLAADNLVAVLRRHSGVRNRS